MGQKDWAGYPQLQSKLLKHGITAPQICGRWDMVDLINTIAGSRVVIGNDSGITKLADVLGIPTITTFLSTGPATIAQAGTLHGHNLLDPTVDEVERLARKILG
jgi:ADP-heptose:LPS heptosyltransferase